MMASLLAYFAKRILSGSGSDGLFLVKMPACLKIPRLIFCLYPFNEGHV